MAKKSLEEIYGITPTQQSVVNVEDSQIQNNPPRKSLEEIYGVQKPYTSPTITPEQPPVAQEVGTGMKETFVDPFTSRFGAIDYNNQGIGSNILQSVGAVAGGAVDVIGKGLLGAARLIPGEKYVEKAVGDVAGVTGEAISSAIPEETKQAIADWTSAHPEAAANLGAIVDIASIIPAGKGASMVKGAVKLESEASKLAKAGEVTQRIVQPSKPELFNADVAAQTFKDIPVDKIKTYSELKKTLDMKNNSDLAKVTAELSKDTTPYRLPNFEINKNGIKFNPVSEAIITLDNLAKDTFDSKLMGELNKFGAVTKDGVKLSKDTIVQNDVNELAKLMGKYENSFKESGGMLKGDKYIKAENIRSSLKDIARTGMSEEVANLDRLVSSRITINKAINNIANKVGREIQSAQKLGAFRKLVKFGVNASDVLSGRLVSTVIRELSRNGKLTGLELEKELTKNLKLLQEATATKDVNKMRQFLKGVGYLGTSQIINNSTQKEEQK